MEIECKDQNHSWIFSYEYDEKVCDECGTIEPNSGSYQDEVIYKNSKKHSNYGNVILLPTEHDKIKYVKESIKELRGIYKRKRIELPLDLLISISKCIPEYYLWSDVYDAYRKHKVDTYWVSWLYDTDQWDGKLPCTEVELLALYDIISYIPIIAKLFKWKSSKRINHFYILARIILLFHPDKDISVIPIKAKPTTIKSYELKFKDICEFYEWTYKPLPPIKCTKVTKSGKTKIVEEYHLGYIYWNKHKIMGKLKKGWTNYKYLQKQNEMRNNLIFKI